uniref:AAA+ ATPase domain-containing protein n=1 Tax=Mola mola TaxID=94237 RepID=A0A3Q4AZN5_MOLML
SQSEKRNGSQALCFNANSKRARKRKVEKAKVGCSDQHTSYLLKDSALRDQDDEPWVDRYSPRSQVSLITFYFPACCHLQGGILLLTGPSGCGKTATVQVLAQELGLRIQEWTNPTNLDELFLRTYTTILWMNGLSCSSQFAQFQDFLLRANKYNCLKMVGDGGATEKKLILVEDFPNQFYRQPGNLHDILRHFVKTSRCPLVFIVSDSLSGDGSLRFLFPRDIQEELDISNISFNPVAPTTMLKVLTRISTLEAGKSCGRVPISDQTVLETLCSGSSGDIRSAINSLQFFSLPEKGLWRMRKDRPASRTSRTKKSKQTKQLEDEHAFGGKDASLFLFRALGKILHCKRECASGPGLPPHLSHHYRNMLLVNPELVVERSHMSGEFFILYLHQNYLDFFSEVEDVDHASEYLSDADLLSADWMNRSTMGDYGSSVATRGLLFSNSQQVSVGFRPLHKPNWLLVNKNENCLAAQSLFRSFCMMPVSLQTELLPYLAKLTNPMRNHGNIHIRTLFVTIGLCAVSRLKLETLSDKEPGLLEVDPEEEDVEENKEGQGGVEEGLPSSQPQPNSSQVLLEGEELIIEQYDSD